MKSLGSDCLDDVGITDITDIIRIIQPLELMAKKKANGFVASHYADIEKLTTTADTDSDLLSALKAHIRRELLLIVRILQLLQKCKQIVTVFKTSGLNDRLEGGSLKQEVETRWMSVLHMLKSFFPTECSGLPSDIKLNQVT